VEWRSDSGRGDRSAAHRRDGCSLGQTWSASMRDTRAAAHGEPHRPPPALVRPAHRDQAAPRLVVRRSSRGAGGTGSGVIQQRPVTRAGSARSHVARSLLRPHDMARGPRRLSPATGKARLRGRSLVPDPAGQPTTAMATSDRGGDHLHLRSGTRGEPCLPTVAHLSPYKISAPGLSSSVCLLTKGQ
jgi:hypothetical protein